MDARGREFRHLWQELAILAPYLAATSESVNPSDLRGESRWLKIRGGQLDGSPPRFVSGLILSRLGASFNGDLI